MARSKEFEINAVLDKAMDLFWRQGYEKTSIQELVTHMGIHRRSMYDTFGDKHDLFMDVMNRYKTMIETKINNRVHQTNSVKMAIRQLFEMTISKEDDQPKGCLFVNTAVELALLDSEVAAKVHEEFLVTEKLFYELLVSGQQTGEISRQHSAENLSIYLNNAWVGLRVLVKTTNDKEKLESLIDTTLAILN
ncbi:TetR/AcrR family transcriptional regulator [Paenibacillus aceris]|uniref:TetR/AcrR family transcriptional repressor of nem operon n=1 Tax=Paenibacillus aceris TaxID=869555 RepID=A0ABS4I0J2_9BACL|nr:TetR/AcrR family transcriptional regulator [Paenibacillus aceris]MBP1963654.1 TetR/AcrR family transcriptional repressor of nem operon [Paenibacillus aceris]NHW36913.1 TetR/AcrR family transcriptional regulator [Paenibacillus aceris]